MKIFWIIFKQNRILNFLTLLAAVLFFFLVLTLVVNIDEANIETKSIEKFEGKNLYIISDDLIETKEQNFFLNNEGYNTLSKFNNEILDSEEFTLYTANWQPIEIADFHGDLTFDPNYEFDGIKSEKFKLNNREYSSVKSLQLSESVFDYNNIQLSEGREFKDKEYLYNDSHVIPVILGNSYSNLYKLHDKIQILIYGEEFEASIVGFFSPMQKIMSSSNVETNLDKYIVLPSLKFPNNIQKYLPKNYDDQTFFRATLFATTNSFILTDYSPLQIRKVVGEIAQNSNFEEFQIIGANSLTIETLFNMSKANLKIVYISLGTLFIIVLNIFVYIMYIKIKQNIRTYSVLLISGADFTNIKKYVKFEFLIINMIGILFPIIPFILIFSQSISFLFSYIFMSGIFLFCIVFIMNKVVNKIFKKIDIVQRLKRGIS